MARLVPGPLLVILGQTATGKTSLALRLADRFDGEIICADSRTFYKGMDIGTAKPTSADRQAVPHHGLDLITPDQSYSAAAFQHYAYEALVDIWNRGRLPLLVGGSGLYIDSVLYDYAFPAPAHPELRQELNRLHVDELQQRLLITGGQLPANSRNPRHLIRAIELHGQPAASRSNKLRANTLVLGLQAPSEILRQRIIKRVDAMLAAGLLSEVGALLKQYGSAAPGLQAPGYRAVAAHIDGSLALDQVTHELVHSHLQLAKRQRTWFKRNNSIHWLDNRDNVVQAVDLATTFLNTQL